MITELEAYCSVTKDVIECCLYGPPLAAQLILDLFQSAAKVANASLKLLQNQVLADAFALRLDYDVEVRKQLFPVILSPSCLSAPLHMVRSAASHG